MLELNLNFCQPIRAFKNVTIKVKRCAIGNELLDQMGRDER